VIVGDRFGCLVVLVVYRTLRGREMVLARCDCGERRHVRMADLKCGHTRSCGHLRLIARNHAARARAARKRMMEAHHAA
jgi:hypothetical protein